MAFSVRYLNRDEDSPVRRLQPTDRVDGERRSTSYRRYLSASLLPAVAGLIERMFRQIGEAKPEFLAIRRRSSAGNPREWRTHGKFFSSFRNPTRSLYLHPRYPNLPSRLERAYRFSISEDSSL